MKLSECKVGLFVEDKYGEIGRIMPDIFKFNDKIHVKVAYPVTIDNKSDFDKIHPYSFYLPEELVLYED